MIEPEESENLQKASLPILSNNCPYFDASSGCSVQKIIEELARTRLQAEENEQKFRALFENASDGIMLLDCRTRRFLMPNQQMCRMLGCTAEEIEQLTLLDILPPNVHESALGHFEQLAAGRPQQVSAQSIRRKDGQIFYADISAALFWLNGAPYAVGIFRDVTEKKRHQEEQARRQQELDAVFQAVPVGISHVKNRIFLRVNQIFCNLIGYSAEELIGRDTSCLYRSKEEFDLWGRSLYSRLQAAGEVMDELTFRHKDGHLLSVLLRGVYLDPQDRSKGELFALTDITDRKQAERALQFTQFAVDHLTTPMYWLDSNLRLIRVNEAACRTLGYTEEELLQMSILDIDPVYSKDKAAQVWATMKQTGSLRLESMHKTKDGRVFPVEIVSSYLNYEGQEYHCAFAQDISERKAAENAREKLLRELRTKNEELESVVFVASHDLRGPLVNIEGFAGEIRRALEEMKTLLEKAGLPPETNERLQELLQKDIGESLHFISAGTAKMDSLLSGLLRLSRVGTATIRIERIRMNSLLQLVLGAMRYEIRRLGAQIHLDTLPDCLGDAVQVNQVFSNLIDNALKYRRPEEPVRIWITGQIQGDEVIYTIQDNGIGIAKEHHEKIFEIFHRLNPDGPQKGEGLGLTIVRRILDRLDGRIWVESELGAGASFFVSLPAVR
ncbi:MAG TPA: PAS domain S-box protein [Anaerohalosphaeraceae bacterium]|nr:PAS domain S-box protein [Anaerohalosphaeraceae bacterium]HOL89342.1 PAS domain S-box protein [Anaerohalosphaeraceae bacterium]HPP56781.1 PAS domain S-box protein [Anaerohalosphaeraceae bacterium]